MVKKMKQLLFKSQRAKLNQALFLYFIFAIIWFLQAALCFLQNQLSAELVLDFAAAQSENMAFSAPASFLSESEDPKLIFENLNRPISQIILEAKFEKDPKEMDLFYTNKEGQGFSVKKRVIGRPLAEGKYLYILPKKMFVKDLRLDFGTLSNNKIEIIGIWLEPSLPARHFFVPSLRQLVGFAICPALALCAIYTIIEAYLLAKKCRRTGKAKP